MPPRRYPRAGAAGSGSVSGEGPGSTGEMALSGAPPMVHPEEGPAGTGWIQENPNKMAATATSGEAPTVNPGKGAAGLIWSGAVALPGREAARAVSDSSGMVPMAQSREDPMVHTGEEGAVGTVSGGGIPMVPGKLAAGSGSGSTEDMLQKNAAASSGGVLPTHPGKVAVSSGSGSTDSGSSGAMLGQKAAVASHGEAAHHDKVVVAAASSGGMPTTLGKVGMGLCEELPQKNATALSGEYPALGALDRNTTALGCEESAAKHSTKKGHTLTSSKIPQKNCTDDNAADMGLGGGMLQKQRSKMEVDTEHPAKESDTAKGIQDSDCNKIVQINDESIQALERFIQNLDDLVKGHTLTSSKIPQKNCTDDNAADMGLGRGMLQKQSSKMEVDTEHPAKESDTAKDIQDSGCNKIVQIKDGSIQELERFIQNLNDLGKGEDISNKEFLDYYERLSSEPGWIDLRVRLEDEELDRQENRHALYRLRYYKHKFKQASMEGLHGDELKEDHHLRFLHKSEDNCNEEFVEEDLYYDKLIEDQHLNLLRKSEEDCSEEFLEEEGFFRRFEENKTFDWFFHPDYLGCSSLNDYQCLVLKNYGGTEYTRWSEYHEYLNSYEIELEYVKYCEELTKQLKWMEDYVDTHRPSVKWSKISSRGAYQAIKIAATSFHKITPTLAYNGYFECKESMVYDYTFIKELDGVYFEIWRRITHGKSFREALEEVYNLNRFPSRQRIMKASLEFDDTMKMMEEEFHTCTAAMTPEVEDKAQELIKEAVKKQANEPKSYEQYIRKKMDIARIIGILDSEESR